MRKLIITFLVLLTSFQVWPKDSNDELAIKNAFKIYTNAIKNKDGATALKYVNQNTINYFEHLRKLNAVADTTGIDYLVPAFDKYALLTFRLQMNKEQLSKLDAKGLFKLYIDSGLAAFGMFKETELGKIEINKKTKTAFALGQYNNQSLDFNVNFAKEENDWKLDLVNIFYLTSKGYSALASQQKQTINEYIIYNLTLERAQTLDPEVVKLLNDKKPVKK